MTKINYKYNAKIVNLTLDNHLISDENKQMFYMDMLCFFFNMQFFLKCIGVM